MSDPRHPNPSSGSETRRRCHQVGVRLLPEEWAKLTADAEAAGEFPGTVLRRAYFPETPAEADAVRASAQRLLQGADLPTAHSATARVSARALNDLRAVLRGDA